MTAKQLFSKTMPFVWAKLLLGGATVLVCVILLAIFMGLGWLFGDTAIVIMFILWLGSIGAVRYFIMRAMGYLVKAGHRRSLLYRTDSRQSGSLRKGNGNKAFCHICNLFCG